MPKKRKRKTTKRRAKFLHIEKEPGATMGDYDYKESIANIKRILVKYKTEFLREKHQSTELFTKDLKKSITQDIQNILSVPHTNKQKLFRALSKKVSKTIKRKTLQQAINDAYQQVNRGEELAIRHSSQRTAKIWTTQFDDRVREWHSAVHGQARLQNQKFRVPYPMKGGGDGVDYLDGPKIPPISVANWINCRCFMTFKVKKK